MKKKFLDTVNSLLLSKNNFSDKDGSHTKNEKHQVNNIDFNHSLNTNNAESSCRYGDFFTEHSSSATCSEIWQYDSSNYQEDICIHGFEYDEFEINEKQDTLCIPEIEAVLFRNELSSDDPDEFFEINDQEIMDIPFINDMETTVKLNRIEKATKIATEVIQACDWDKENISLLEQVFYENGWGMTRVSIERELNEGLIPEELALALFIRQLWTENPQYWISFIHITSNQPGQETKAIYKNMSWAESLRIIRSFNNVPSEEELQLFIYKIYDDWYCSTTLQREHKAFFKYLQYYTDLSRRSLPGENEIFSFVESYYIESL